MSDMQMLRTDCWIRLPDGTTTTAAEIMKWRESISANGHVVLVDAENLHPKRPDTWHETELKAVADKSYCEGWNDCRAWILPSPPTKNPA